MTVDDAIRDLLDVSTDVLRVVVLDADGSTLGSGPHAAGAVVAAALDRLWQVARETGPTGAASLEHVAVELDGAAIVAVEADGRRAVALTVPHPPLGLVLFDLRTCLADAFPAEDPTGKAM